MATDRMRRAFLGRLRRRLKALDLTQADLARRVGVAPTTVSGWFVHGEVPSVEIAMRLPAALRVSGHWLLTGAGPESPHHDGPSASYRAGARDALADVAEAVEAIRRDRAGRR